SNGHSSANGHGKGATDANGHGSANGHGKGATDANGHGSANGHGDRGQGTGDANDHGATDELVLNGHDHTGAGAGHEVARYSAAVAFNVLEHIPDHVGALRAMAALVRPGGAVVLIVPAFPSAMSAFDRAIGHQRRYTRAMLRDALDAAGLRIEELRYVNPVGLLSWYVTVKTLRMTPRNGLALKVYDRAVVPLARAADRLGSPFGQSVFAVARVS
ncbi:MAG TPA: methyltransferase domain-containing protein, partial [Micromonosporaceae bacterium]